MKSLSSNKKQLAILKNRYFWQVHNGRFKKLIFLNVKDDFYLLRRRPSMPFYAFAMLVCTVGHFKIRTIESADKSPRGTFTEH